MKRLVGVFGVLAAVVAVVAGCGGGSNSSGGGEKSALANTAIHRPAHEEARESPKQERRERKENREFKEREEKRIAEESEEAKKKKAEKKHPKPKPEPEPSPTTEVDPVAAEEFHYFKGTDLGNWEIAYSVCAVTPEKQLAAEFHTERNWAAIGHAYGAGYREPFNIAPEEGCMAAVKDSPDQREAMFALMEENE
jgi:hypothetical protein